MFSSLIGSLLSRESASLTSSSRAMSLWAHCAQAHALAVGVGDNEASLHESEADGSASTAAWAMIDVARCERVPFSAELVAQHMLDCSRYHEWWPRTYDFTVERCTPQCAGSLVHFRSIFGNYSTAIEAADARHLHMRYFGELLEGHTEWKIVPQSERSCDLCYAASLRPKTYAAQTAAAVSSKEYLGSYFDPLIDSLQKELATNHASERERTNTQSLDDRNS